MVTPDGVLKILDFGLAKVMAAPLGDVEDRARRSRGTARRPGRCMGTLEYMSPEQASGRALDHRTDQFSLRPHPPRDGHRALRRSAATRRPRCWRRSSSAIPEPLRRLRAGRAGRPRVAGRAMPAEGSRAPLREDGRAGRRRWPCWPAARGRARWPRAPPVLPPTSPAVSVEVVPPRPLAPATPPIYHVQAKKRVRRYDEGELADADPTRQAQRASSSSAATTRRSWQPLFESRVYRREVPTLDDPRDAARTARPARRGRALLRLRHHRACVMYATQGHFPFWLAIWGAVLA